MEKSRSWSSAHDWKSCRRQKRLEGSNPSFSAKCKRTPKRVFFLYLGMEFEGGIRTRREQAQACGRKQSGGLFSPTRQRAQRGERARQRSEKSLLLRHTKGTPKGVPFSCGEKRRGIRRVGSE